MAEATTTEKPAGSTILTADEKPEIKPEEKLYPTEEQKAAQEKIATDKAAADKAESEKQAAAKAASEVAKAEPEKTTEETKPPTKTKETEEKTTSTSSAEYDLKLPDGSPLGAEVLDSIKKRAVEGKLTKEQAEGLIAEHNAGALALKTLQEKAFEQTKVSWKEAVEKDPEMGGEHLAETALLSSRAFKSLASAELQVWAEKTGLGQFPEFVRMMAKVGKMMAEDKFIRGNVDMPAPKRSKEEILYGKTTPGADGKVPVQEK